MTRVGCLHETEVSRLFKTVRQVLSMAIKSGGTSISDYRRTGGEPGTFQNMLMVYRRKDERCPECNNVIQKIVVGGRGTYFCPGCQVEPG